MDSLLANYASSDEEEQQHEGEDEGPKPKSSLFSSLPPPKSSLFSSLPPPKSAPPISPETLTHLPPPNPNSQIQKQELQKPSPLFSSLPAPKSSHFSLSPPKPGTLNSPRTQTHLSPENPNSQIQKQELDQPSSLFSSLPPPKSSHFPSLSPPKSDTQKLPQTLTHLSPENPNSQIQEQKLDKPSSLFSSLPHPKSYSSQFSPLPPLNPKKVVQVKLPAMKPSNFDDDDDDDDDREREGRKTEPFMQAPSVKSFLSSIPAPKNSSSTLGALPSTLGSGRRSIVEANIPSSNLVTETEVGVHSNEVNFSESSVYASSSVISEYGVSGGEDDASGWVSSSGNYEINDGNAVYGNYDYYGQYDSNWGERSADVAQSSVIGVGESVMKVPGKRGRNEIPQEIVEVTQDELTKNRPREDQVKMTGIAFGPSYQPVSTKGKPTKLHKRKHQIGSLYFDMKQKETELAERRSKGFLTKAETQAKYGW